LREDQHEQASLCDSAAPAAGRGLFRRYHATVAGPLAEFLTSRHSSISPSPDGVFQETGPAFSSKCCPSRRTRSLAPESNLYHFVFRSSLMASILGLPHVRLQLAAGDCFQMARGRGTRAAGSRRSSTQPTDRQVRARPAACNPLLSCWPVDCTELSQPEDRTGAGTEKPELSLCVIHPSPSGRNDTAVLSSRVSPWRRGATLRGSHHRPVIATSAARRQSPASTVEAASSRSSP